MLELIRLSKNLLPPQISHTNRTKQHQAETLQALLMHEDMDRQRKEMLKCRQTHTVPIGLPGTWDTACSFYAHLTQVL